MRYSVLRDPRFAQVSWPHPSWNCCLGIYALTRTSRRHVISYHSNKSGTHQCRRCKEWFKSEVARDDHVLQESACAVKDDRIPDDQEDGITQETINRLVNRRNGEKVDTWKKLWGLLFPLEVSCPSSGKINQALSEQSEVLGLINHSSQSLIHQWDSRRLRNSSSMRETWRTSPPCCIEFQ